MLQEKRSGLDVKECHRRLGQQLSQGSPESADGLFAMASEKSDSVAHRVESFFNISFWGFDLVISYILDLPWTCSLAVLQVLQMCELSEDGRLESQHAGPGAMSLRKGFPCICNSGIMLIIWPSQCTVELEEYNQPKGQIAPLTIELFPKRTERKRRRSLRLRSGVSLRERTSTVETLGHHEVTSI